MATLTQEQRDTAAELAARANEHGVTAVDLSDDREFQYFRDMFVAGGTTPDKYPGFHAALTATRDAHVANSGPPQLPADGPWETTAFITALGAAPGGAAASSGIVSVVDGGAGVYADLLVSDPQGRQLAHKADTAWVDGEFLKIATDLTGALPAVDGMMAILNAAVKQGPNLIPLHAVSMQATAAYDPVVQDPRIRIAGHTQIIIGLSRNGNDPDVDYGFPQADPDTGVYMLPLDCTIDFGQTIDFETLAFAAALTRAEGQGGGTVYLPVDQVQKVLNNTTSDTDSQITTSCPPADPISFTQIHWSSNDVTYLTATFSAKAVETGKLLTAVIASTEAGGDDQVDGTTLIPPILFIWHCVDAATTVVRADGAETEICQLVRGDEIQGPGGALRSVHATWAAPHRGRVLRLRTSGGHELILSLRHALMTPEGPVPADELAPGAQVNTVDGPQEIETLDPIDEYDGVLWNVSLGAVGEDAEPAEHTFMAGGIESADHEVQAQQRRRQLADPDWVRAALPADLIPDYESSLRDRQPAA